MLSDARALLAGRTLAVLTGAGLSTDSGIPDYRGENSPRRTPMTFQDFVGDAAHRRRYWVGSHLGWRAFSGTLPNAGHEALAAMEAAGVVTGLITQNVDGLHLRAGSRRVIELHGGMRHVVCLACHTEFPRDEIAGRLERDNPALATPDAVELGPDGDVLPESWEHVTVPDCEVCGGILKPDVVFFGELVPADRSRAAEAIIDEAGALLVAGSSLAVNSGLRLVARAQRRGVPIVIVNRGATKGDRRADLTINAGTSETLAGLAAALTASGART
ncbi:Sir2 family NAD-dependent protein deacetylase [Demequina sp. NBRC 110057]|uniref:Sir2 family NAD-dependent protein deacetylase n=1 Tax=Demequina sp. NBRC 110057 TaxID=1570346 RepID=UPI000A005A6E|nr:Sir2 family NAD-dependent protein deacetylase [Demequina sp. NBRC 110057]